MLKRVFRIEGIGRKALVPLALKSDPSDRSYLYVQTVRLLAHFQLQFIQISWFFLIHSAKVELFQRSDLQQKKILSKYK